MIWMGITFKLFGGDSKDPTLQAVKPEDLKEIYRDALPLNYEYISRIKGDKSGLGLLRKAFWRPGYAFSYGTQFRNYA